MIDIKIPMALAVATFIMMFATSANAERNSEIGAFGGWHIFDSDNDIGDNNFEGAPGDSFVFGVRIAFPITSRFDAEGEVAIIPSETQPGTDTTVFAGRLHGLYHFVEERSFRPFALVGGEITAASPSEGRSDLDTLLHAGVGAKYSVENNWGIRADLRLLLPPAESDSAFATDWEVLVGLYKSFGTEKRTVAPPRPKDTDGDGINDGTDECPAEAEDFDEFDDTDGCPDTDNDGDSVPDAQDKCPLEAEDDNGVDSEDGCPEPDPDADTLVGSQDKCPDQPEDKDGFEDSDGCPDPDNDADGIADPDDKCPLKSETANGYKDEDGCPDEPPAELARFTGAIKGIKFRTGSAVILASSNKVLNQAAEVLKTYPRVRLEISGHTDNRGNADKNQALSQSRADAVKAYLVGKGVAGDRLTAKGYGPSTAIADNKTAAGRAQNRRVEFKLLTK